MLKDICQILTLYVWKKKITKNIHITASNLSEKKMNRYAVPVALVTNFLKVDRFFKFKIKNQLRTYSD